MRSAKAGNSRQDESIENRPAPEVPEPFRALLDLFQGPLAEIRFPGVDHDTLTSACASISQKVQEVAKARAVLDETQRALDAQLDEVKKLGRRALAYLEIYAEGNDGLLESVAEVRAAIGTEAAVTPKPPPRRRKKKKASGPQLPLAPDAEELSSESEAAV
ncbi:MAG: hypothetical protein AAF449_19235 [Myxococcota bacterium]